MAGWCGRGRKGRGEREGYERGVCWGVGREMGGLEWFLEEGFLVGLEGEEPILFD